MSIPIKDAGRRHDLSFNPFGSLSSRNSLKEYITSHPNSQLRILLLGCGSILDVIRAVSTSGDREINLFMNDSSEQVVARNILMLKIVLNPEFNPENPDDLYFFWDVWYNTQWSEATKQRFVKEVSQIQKGLLPESVTVVNCHLNHVWDSWISCASSMTPILFENILKERMACMTYNKETSDINLSSSQVVEGLVQQIKMVIDVYNLPATLTKDILHVIGSYLETGNNDLNEEIKVCINPTFLHTSTQCWSVQSSAHPYEEYLTIMKATLPHEGFLRYCHQNLANQLTLFRDLEKSISSTFYITDALDLCYYKLTEKFDVIDACNLHEQTGFVNLISAADLRLCDHSDATLLTEKMVCTLTTVSIADYIQEVLCSPLSMLTTIYGFSLTDHVLLGNPVPATQVRRVSVPLKWRRAHRSNLFMSLTPSISSVMDQLQTRCFHPSIRWAESYSPFTYGRVTASLTSRINWKEADFLPTFSSSFRLAWKTVLAWRDGLEMIQLSYSFVYSDNATEPRQLRLVLIDSDCPDQRQFIDDIKQDLDVEEKKITVSFLLLKDHGLNDAETLVHLEDILSSEPFSSAALLKEFSCLQFTYSKPCGGDSNPFPPVASNICEEFEDRYQLEICLPDIQQFDGLTISTDGKYPSEAGHQLIIDSAELGDKTPLVLNFPFPFKVEEVETIVVEKKKILQFILWKSIYEPRPSDWFEEMKWGIDLFDLWDSMYTQKDLSCHMSAQFRYSDLKSQALEMEQLTTTTLNEVRETIRTIFVASILTGHDVFVIQAKNATQPRIDWYLLTHPPVLISPLGSPMLRITANDHALAQKLVDQRRLDQQTAAKDFERVFSTCKSSEVYTIFIQSEEEANLLRYLFRLNASKIHPATKWPIEDLPSGYNSPWLSTFFCPLYVDQAGSDSEMEEFLEATRNLNIQSAPAQPETPPQPVECCTTCKQASSDLKRCARCKAVKYCSVKCQRSDWNAHKLSCIR